MAGDDAGDALILHHRYGRCPYIRIPKRRHRMATPFGCIPLREDLNEPGSQARPANSPVRVFTHTFSSLVMYSGTWISMPVLSLAGLVRLVALAPFSSGAVSTTVSNTLVGTCRPTGASSITCT